MVSAKSIRNESERRRFGGSKREHVSNRAKDLARESKSEFYINLQEFKE